MEVLKNKKRILYSIIIPVFNEEEAILGTVQTIKKTMDNTWPDDYELIIVNDGSTDKTCEKLKHIDAQIMTHTSNCGYGASLKTGIRAAKGETIIITDADGTYPLTDIPQLISHMSNYDMVIGARTKGKNHSLWLRRFLKVILRRLGSYVVGAPIPDLNSGFRAIKKDILMKYFRIIPSGFSFTSTITMAMMSDGYQVLFLPIHYFPRLGHSKFRPLIDTKDFFLLIIRTCLYFSPLRVFVPMSSFLLFVAFIKMLYDIFYMPLGRFIISQTVLLLTLVGIQTFILGLVADLIVRRTKGE